LIYTGYYTCIEIYKQLFILKTAIALFLFWRFGVIIKNMEHVTLFQIQYRRCGTNLASLYLGTSLKKEGIEFGIKIFPCYKLKLDLNKLYSFFADSGEIIAAGCWSDALPHVLIALKRLKEKFPEKIVILGGVGPTEVAQDIMREFRFIDFIITGCGIKPLPQLIKTIAIKTNDYSRIGGLVYRKGRAVITNNRRDFYPVFLMPEAPDYSLVKNIKSVTKFFIKSCSGCPYACAHCRIPGLSANKVYYRDIRKVVEEIKLIKKLKTNNNFYAILDDEAFVLNRKRVIEFCDLLKKERLGVHWTCYGRVDRMDESLIKIMSESGCEGIYYGVESGSNKTLRKINKGFTVEEALDVVLMSKKFIKRVTASFIFLYPFETKQEFIQTLMTKAYLESKGVLTQLHPLTPVKGSAIYLEYNKTLRLLRDIPSTFHDGITSLPRECIGLIKKYPRIFYYYYYYYFKALRQELDLLNHPG